MRVKMKSLKRNQIIIFVIALMLVSAGYLNYTANNTTNTMQTSSTLNSTDYAAIGDARLVSSNATATTNVIEGVVPNTEENNGANEESSAIVENKEQNAIVENNTEETTKQTSATNVDEYFSASKLTRDTMYSQMIETYEKILANANIASDQKTIAQTEIKNINDNKNKIMICENLIKTKGIENVVIFVNGESISVVIKSESLQDEQVAQIQNIVAREMQVEINNIHISNK